MKSLFVTLFALLALSGCLGADYCYNDVTLECSQGSDSVSLAACNAVYGGYGHHGNLANEMQAYVNLHIEKSFEYLLTSAYYNNYQTNRAGFSKVFKKLADNAWEQSIDLIKHITNRGGIADFSARSTQETPANKNYTVELHELESLARALDSEKLLAERAFYIHREATRNSQNLHDAEIAQYLEEKFVEYQAESIRKLAGHTNDLKKFVTKDSAQDLSLGLYIFDEYLQKTV